MFNFLTGSLWFAAAGALAASVPILIHLFYRGQVRVIHWAAMDFLGQAETDRRSLRKLRHIIVLLLRVLALLLFSAALAQPQVPKDVALNWRIMLICSAATLIVALIAIASRKRPVLFRLLVVASIAVVALGLFHAGRIIAHVVKDDSAGSTRYPIHLVIAIDNSLSMSHDPNRDDMTPIRLALRRAEKLIDSLPAESLVTLVPFCPGEQTTNDPTAQTTEQAKTVLRDISILESGCDLETLWQRVCRACDQKTGIGSAQVVVFTDHQAVNYRPDMIFQNKTEIGSVQIVDVGHLSRDNTWIESFSLDQPMLHRAELGTFRAVIRHTGATIRSDSKALLHIGGKVVQTIALPEFTAEDITKIDFKYQLPRPVESDPKNISTAAQPLKAQISITPGDGLPIDDERSLSVTAADELPVYVVDQHAANNFDHYDSASLLDILWTGSDRSVALSHHLPWGNLTGADLSRARVLVLVGIESPGEMTGRLRSFVRQGGRLLIIAGGQFDAKKWNELAFHETGPSLLPCRLEGIFDWRGKEELRRIVNHDSLFDFQELSANDRDALFLATPIRIAVGFDPEIRSAEFKSFRILAEVIAENTNSLENETNRRSALIVEATTGKGKVVFVATGIDEPWSALSQGPMIFGFRRLVHRLLRESLPRHKEDRPASESQLAAAESSDVKRVWSAVHEKTDWIGRDDSLQLKSVPQWETQLWKWLLAVAGVCLLSEMAVLVFDRMFDAIPAGLFSGVKA